MQNAVNLRNNFIPALKKRGWTIEEFAQKCDLTKAGMINIFNNNDTKLSTLYIMCKVADIPITDVLQNQLSDNNTLNEPQAQYGDTPLHLKYTNCLENNNHLTTQLRKCQEELGALKKQGNPTTIKTK